MSLFQLNRESSANDAFMQRRLAKEAKEEEKLRKNAEKVHSPHLTFIEIAAESRIDAPLPQSKPAFLPATWYPHL